jgi:hypothetical protein
MIPLRIAGHTRYLGAPREWKPEVDGPCGFLAIRDEDTTAGRAMASAWEPTPEELARLNAGAPIILHVIGIVHPPVDVRVGYPPKEAVNA